MSLPSRANRLNIRPCSACAHLFRADKSQCPSCSAWNRDGAAAKKEAKDENRVKRASDVKTKKKVEVIRTGLADKAFSKLDGGLVTTGVYLLGGAAGSGKSTLCLSLIERAAKVTGRDGLYLGLEEAEEEVTERAERLGVNLESFWIYPMGCEDEIGPVLKERNPSLVIVDSIVKLSGHNQEEAVKVCGVLKSFASLLRFPIIVINHVNKDQALAGLNALQHEVDWTGTLFPIEPKDGRSPQAEPPRELEWYKSRYGGKRVTHFEMEDTGMREVELPWMKEGGRNGKQIPEFEGEEEGEDDDDNE